MKETLSCGCIWSFSPSHGRLAEHLCDHHFNQFTTQFAIMGWGIIIAVIISVVTVVGVIAFKIWEVFP